MTTIAPSAVWPSGGWFSAVEAYDIDEVRAALRSSGGFKDEDVPAVLDLNDMARLLRVSPFTVRARHKAGRLPPIIPLTRRLTWAKEAVLPWLQRLQEMRVGRRGGYAPVQSKGVSLTVGRRKSP